MSNIKIKLTRNGPRDIRISKGVEDDLMARAERIASAAGPGMEARQSAGPRRSRARAAVVTTTYEARYAEATRRALTNSIMAGR